MIGIVIDLNKTDAFLNLPDGTTRDISLAHLPKNIKLGDSIEVNLSTFQMSNKKLIDFF